MIIVYLYLYFNKEKIIFFPPPKEPKAITLDLTQFKSPPKPIVVPKKKTPQRPVQQKLIQTPAPLKKIENRPEAKRKLLKTKKILVVKESTQENNTTTKEKLLKQKKKEESVKLKIKKLKEEKRKKAQERKKAKLLEKKIKAEKIKKEKLKKIKQKKQKEQKRIKERQKRIKELKAMEKKMLQEQKRRLKEYKSPLANSLMKGGASYRPTQSRQLSKSSSTNLINKLYGKEFDTYSPQEKRFLKANLGRIHTITQKALSRNGYPESAIRMGQEGVNIVSFYLHPNGNITQLKLEKSMGHSSLDRNTLQVIRIAYSSYPLPQKRTKIKFYVNYTIN